MPKEIPKRLLEPPIQSLPADRSEWPEYGYLNDELIELHRIEERLLPEALQHVVVEMGPGEYHRPWRSAGFQTRENPDNPDSITILL